MRRAVHFLAILAVTLTSFLISAPAGHAKSLVTVLRYDASRAQEFRTYIDQAAAVWNSSVRNVRLEPGTPAHFVVYADNGWPRTLPTSLGRGTIYMGRQATAEGHNPLRIATHEIGHILGLPDRRTGLCTDLMSGASAGTSCTNPNPNAAEKAQVERNFTGGTPQITFNTLHVDR
ncbi:peptidase [Sphaerisporangium krabiense]|uniref:Extracellular small neutral protease n=1 Tax=Sphaerisporangium krabiense TaxID=763782 RepID=A0A7W8Z8I4_9ACTN|nr:snapalysin family zinc-dependent metalloprotease [Sphaerisporangium krabiense]MBB5629342.1 snapalysin [Sphaerisporangium krabiense]GII65807.1 peptidase [Sphaerisporangium krabiense]